MNFYTQDIDMKRAATLFAVLLSLHAGTALASDEPLSQAVSNPAEESFANAIGDGELAASRGAGLGSILNLSQLNAEVTGNSANNTVSGNNSIDASAFSHAVGLNSVIQNSGNNVVIQNSMTVAVTFVNN
jgi:hypothetical protein